jgi:non-ribosomal peptide synthetase component F
VFATTYQVPPDSPVAAPVPIGRAIKGTETFILDENLQPVDGSAIGDLYLGGDGLAWGYLHAGRSPVPDG